MIGQVFGRWTVQARGEDYIYLKSGKKAKRYICLCICGKEKLVHSAHLKNGSSTSCGCYNIEVSTKHGMSGTKEHSSWYNLVFRCSEKSTDKDKIFYSEISVQDSWNPSKGGSFENFYKDMGPCPPGYEIDRIESKGNYTKENCRWASETTQSENRGKYSNNTSGQAGVCWCNKSNRWKVSLQSNNITYSAGAYVALEEAISARKKLELEVLGYNK